MSLIWIINGIKRCHIHYSVPFICLVYVQFFWSVLYVEKYCIITISSHSPLCAGEQVSEEPLGVVRLCHGLTQTVDKDRSPAVGLQHRAEESL